MLNIKVGRNISFVSLVEKISSEEYPFFLDSCEGYEDKLGKFSFAGFNPIAIFKAKDNVVEVMEEGFWAEFSHKDSLEAFNDFIDKYKRNHSGPFPFNSGAVGYFSYDLCHKIEKIPRKAKDDNKIPDIFFCIYDGIYVFDHANQEVHISAQGIKKNPQEIVDELLTFTEVLEKEEKDKHDKKLPRNSSQLEKSEFESNFSKEDYLSVISKIKRYIKIGDVYQVNLTQRFRVKNKEKPWTLFKKLRKINPAPFAAFLDFKDHQILSSSPERFVQISGKRVETRPIKGTIARGTNAKEDAENKKFLSNSEKDKSELLMIVDLERNDLGKISKPGTVKVEEIFSIETYPSVFHLVSTISGELKENISLKEMIRSLFPGGSITGTPKIRAMEIIDEIEPTQRNIYTGSLGYIDFNGNLDLNIVIRTILIKGQNAFFQAGGAIVWDSDQEAEYEETLVKSKALKGILGDE